MAHSHNPDVPVGEEELDASFSVDSFFADEPEALAGPSAPPPANKLCVEGSYSAPLAPASGHRAPLARGNSVPPSPRLAAASQQTRWPTVCHVGLLNVGAFPGGASSLILPSTLYLCFPFLDLPVSLLTGKLVDQNPTVHAFKKDPGLLYIGLEGDVEAWTCAVCSFCCGWALDSVMQHLKTPAHQSHLLDTVKKAAPIVELGDTPAHLSVQRGAFAKFLTEEV
ncbi:unnamed protein product [Closterium sp. Naga37s-1]|nr:unnamed protein product [Closterium sp. Naga37s-1]